MVLRLLLFAGTLTIVNANTRCWLTWGTYGSGDGQFMFPYGVAVDSSGNVYVADNGNDRVQKFDSDGTFLTRWGSYGRGDGQFKYPYGVAVDSNGNVYVTDSISYINGRVQKFDSDGTFLTKWGSGSGDGQFMGPIGVAVDSSDNVYVADSLNHRVQRFGYVPMSPKSLVVYGGVQGVGTGKVETRRAGKSANIIYTISGPIRWTGDISGGGKEDATWIFHKGSVSAISTWTLTNVEVDGKVGDLVITGVSGSWRIMSGTGDLANLHGQGTYWLSGVKNNLEYAGQVHFHP